MAASVLGLDLNEVKGVVVHNLAVVPDFLLSPRAKFEERFERENPFADAVPFAAVMFVLPAAAGAALGLASSIDGSSIAYISVGIVTSWLIYGIFLHGFAFLLGARRGVRNTLAAYLYVIGMLQPVLVVLLWAITWIAPGAVSFREITSFGGSGAAAIVASGNYLSFGWSAMYRCVAGVLILGYFAIALVPAQRITLLRSSLASLGSFIFFLAVYLTLFAIGYLAGSESLLRLSI